MIQNALHILGPVTSIHLDPFVLLHSQPAGVAGYVMICRNDRGSGREYHLLCFDGEGPDVCVRLTPEARSFIGFDTAQSEYNQMDKGRVMVHLFTIDGPAMERFYATVLNEPCFKIRIDTLRKSRVETLVRAYGSRELLAERNDFTSEQPRMEFQATIPGQRLPAFAMGYGRGGFLLYRCLESVQSSTLPSTVPSDLSPRAESAQRGAHPISVQTAPAAESADVAVEAARSRSISLARAQAGARITPAGAFVEIAQEAQGPGPARAKHTALPTEPPEQLEFLSGSKLPGNTASSAAVSPKGSAQVREDAPIPEIAELLQQLVDEFRTQTMSILGRKGEVVFESCERQLRKEAPQFRSDEIDDETAVLALDLIDAVVREAPLLKRSKLRGIILPLIADLYNKHFEVLNRRGLIPRVEEIYFAHKK